jgi:hypothetical protein
MFLQDHGTLLVLVMLLRKHFLSFYWSVTDLSLLADFPRLHLVHHDA